MFTDQQTTFTEQQEKDLKRLLKTNKGLVAIAKEMRISYHTFRLCMANSDKCIQRFLVDKSLANDERAALAEVSA